MIKDAYKDNIGFIDRNQGYGERREDVDAIKEKIVMKTEDIASELVGKSVDELIIKNCNWKYKKKDNFENKSERNKNRYSWQDLYKLSGLPEEVANIVAKEFSNFAHGISTSLDHSQEYDDSKISLALTGIEFITHNIIGLFIEFTEFCYDTYKYIPEVKMYQQLQKSIAKKARSTQDI